jgi:hypothetical protein
MGQGWPSATHTTRVYGDEREGGLRGRRITAFMAFAAWILFALFPSLPLITSRTGINGVTVQNLRLPTRVNSAFLPLVADRLSAITYCNH